MTFDPFVNSAKVSLNNLDLFRYFCHFDIMTGKCLSYV